MLTDKCKTVWDAFQAGEDIDQFETLAGISNDAIQELMMQTQMEDIEAQSRYQTAPQAA